MPVEISSRSNPRLRSLVDDRQRLLFFEGEKLVGDLLARGTPIRLLMYTRDWLPLREMVPVSACIGEEWIVSEPVMAKVSDFPSPPPVIAVLDWVEKPIPWREAKWVAAFVGLQDPGNLGTSLRCAAAFGWPGIALCGDGVRPNHPKLVRAAQTALLDLSIRRYRSVEEILGEAERNGFAVYLTSPPSETSSLAPRDIVDPALLVFGNEGQGIDPELRQRFPVVSIPQEKKVESLNVGIAACLFFYELSGRGRP